MKNIKIALLGGSFNPIHNKHIEIIKQIQKTGVVDEVWILPCGKHTFGKELVHAKDRIKMIKLAIKNMDGVKICLEEIKNNSGVTIDTIRSLKKKYPYEFYFVIGSDILREIHLWDKYEELFKEVKFIVVLRKGFPLRKIKGMKVGLVLNDKINGISSTEIRTRAKRKLDLMGLVPELVKDYIMKRGLYK